MPDAAVIGRGADPGDMGPVTTDEVETEPPSPWKHFVMLIGAVMILSGLVCVIVLLPGLAPPCSEELELSYAFQSALRLVETFGMVATWVYTVYYDAPIPGKERLIMGSACIFCFAGMAVLCLAVALAGESAFKRNHSPLVWFWIYTTVTWLN